MKDDKNLYVGRGRVLIIDSRRFPEKDSPWCNKYKVGKDGTIEEVLEKYEKDIREKIATGKVDIDELRNKNLGCWCVDKDICDVRDDPCCHGEVLLKILEEEK